MSLKNPPSVNPPWDDYDQLVRNNSPGKPFCNSQLTHTYELYDAMEGLQAGVLFRASDSGTSFTCVKESIGIVFVVAPTGARDIHSNIMGLSEMSKELVDVLTTVSNAAVVEGLGFLSKTYLSLDFFFPALFGFP